mmetsp:Transcript_11180/g.18453  ORF Transcript_11180/g.18453 Transcript_11180/m.18453 type:complete len:96 (-) Transcript_11180:984-1271(-)
MDIYLSAAVFLSHKRLWGLYFSPTTPYRSNNSSARVQIFSCNYIFKAVSATALAMTLKDTAAVVPELLPSPNTVTVVSSASAASLVAPTSATGPS